MRNCWCLLVGILVSILSTSVLAAQVQITTGPIIEIADATSAIISWSTNQPSGTRVWYSEDPDDMTQIAEGDERTTLHRVRIEGLHPNTRYYFQVESIRSSTSPTDNSEILSFRTVAPGQPSIRNQKASLAQKSVLNLGESENVRR